MLDGETLTPNGGENAVETPSVEEETTVEAETTTE